VAATWAGIVAAYDSFYWLPEHRGLPVSFFVVAAVVLEFALASLVQAMRQRSTPRTDVERSAYGV
jgi:hypothetical protein